MDTGLRPSSTAAVVGAALALGYLAMGSSGLYVQNLVVTIVLYAYWAVAWNILGGMAGQLSFGHAAFVGLGAYTSSVLYLQFGVSPWLGMILGGAVAAAYGLFVGYLSFRYGLRDVYFALLTLAFAQILYLLFANSAYYGPFGGEGGLRFPVEEPGFLKFQFATKGAYYAIIALMLAAALSLSWWLRRNKAGYYLIAIRENERAAQAAGISVIRYKLLATALSGFLTALGGTFYAQYYLFIDPLSVLHVSLSIGVLLPAIVGGTDTVFGPVVGALILMPISEQLRQTLSGGLAGAHLVVYALVIILVMRLIPGGLVGWAAERGWLGRPAPRPPVSEEA